MRTAKWISMTVATLALFAGTAARASDDDRGIPAEQMISAIQIAVAAQPGNVKEAEVESEGGRLLVEVKIVGADGKEVELKVDPQRNEVVRSGRK